MKESFLLQILVVVASIQMRTLKIDVGQGFMRTEVDHELIIPWLQGHSCYAGFYLTTRKGVGSTFCDQAVADIR